MSRRRGRAGQRGSETVELVAGLPLLGLAVLLAWQGVVLVRQQIEAQNDARELARRAALCGLPAPPPRSALLGIDPAATGATVAVVPVPALESIEVRVRLPPQMVLPGLALGVGSDLAPRATVVMRREPC